MCTQTNYMRYSHDSLTDKWFEEKASALANPNIYISVFTENLCALIYALFILIKLDLVSIISFKKTPRGHAAAYKKHEEHDMKWSYNPVFATLD